MPNRIYRGPDDRQPHTTSDKTVNGALLPATFVTEGVSQFSQATAFGPNLRLLSNREYYSTGHFTASDPLLTAYASGDSGIAYHLEPTHQYLGAVAAATYTYGQELTVGAAGRLVAAVTGNVVIGFAREAGIKAAGALIDFEVANFYTKP
jgi:hypothetical protein